MMIINCDIYNVILFWFLFLKRMVWYFFNLKKESFEILF